MIPLRETQYPWIIGLRSYYWFVSGILGLAAIQRLSSTSFEIDADVMIIVSGLGIIVKIFIVSVLHGSKCGGHSYPQIYKTKNFLRKNLSSCSLILRIFGNVSISVTLLGASLIIKYYPRKNFNQSYSVYGVTVLLTTVPILRDIIRILMEDSNVQ
ncbi:hypothetical protein Avbf_14253 [Armadillidium vulgare]|nr:hypothetical protein Avbf_14253 [Armadillidium vulgare]